MRYKNNLLVLSHKSAVFTPLSTKQKNDKQRKQKESLFLWGEILDVMYFYVNITENLNRHKQSASLPTHTHAHTKAYNTTDRCELTKHISVMVSSNTPPASSAPSPTSLTFQARDGSLRSSAFSCTTCWAICRYTGLHFFPLYTHTITLMCTVQIMGTPDSTYFFKATF